jgi:nicotinamidase-related amidase
MWLFNEPAASPLISSEWLAILMIDMQTKFLADLDPGERDKIIQGQLRLLEQAKALETLVINVRFAGDNGPTDQRLIDSWLRMTNKAPLLKYKDDAFSVPTLNPFLQKRGVKTLVLAGINASFCVLETAKSAVLRGYEVHVADDLIADGRTLRDIVQPSNKSQPWFVANGHFHCQPITIVPPA